MKDEQVFVKIVDNLYRLNDCPQRDFFKDLDLGATIVESNYYLLVSSLYDDVDFDEMFRDKAKMWKNFDPDLWNTTPVAIRTAKNTYVVEDGAHRLALRSLRGYSLHRVGISLWYFDKGRQKNSLQN